VTEGTVEWAQQTRYGTKAVCLRENMRSRVNGEQYEESHGSSDEDGGESDGTYAVEYSGGQHPVVLHPHLLVVLIAWPFVAANSTPEKIADFHQQLFGRLRRYGSIWVVSRSFRTTKLRRGRRSIHAQTFR